MYSVNSKSARCLIAALTLCIAPAVPAIDIPGLINYQGRLTDAGGDPVADGAYQVQFTIWKDSLSTSPAERKWVSGTVTVDVAGGLFTHLLGSSEELPSWTFGNDSVLWLGIAISGEAEMQPRTRLTSVPYSLRSDRSESAHLADSAVFADTAEYARSAPGDAGDITAVTASDGLLGGGTSGDVSLSVNYAGTGSAVTVARSDHLHDAQYVNEGQSGSVTSGMIADNSILLQDIAPNGASDGQIIQWSTASSSWTLASAGAGGWVDNGTRVVLASITDSVGIGTPTPTKKFEVIGDAHVHGELTFQEKTGYISIPAPAFQAANNAYQYGVGLYLENNESGPRMFNASVQLPHASRVTRMTFFWWDNNPSDDGKLVLFKNMFNNSLEKMAADTSNGSSGIGSSYDDQIGYSTIDNSNGAYFLQALLYSEMGLYGAVIEYKYSTTY